jgi:hypothetical protein
MQVAARLNSLFRVTLVLGGGPPLLAVAFGAPAILVTFILSIAVFIAIPEYRWTVRNARWLPVGVLLHGTISLTAATAMFIGIISRQAAGIIIIVAIVALALFLHDKMNSLLSK